MDSLESKNMYTQVYGTSQLATTLRVKLKDSLQISLNVLIIIHLILKANLKVMIGNKMTDVAK